MQQLVILTGMSGAGKTVALRTFEDMEYYCVDNLPLTMLAEFVTHIESDVTFYPKVAVGIDIRSQNDNLSGFGEQLAQLKMRQLNVKVMFLNAEEQVLIQRFSETRRRHPLSTEQFKFSLTEAVRKEADIMQQIKQSADLVIDTSQQAAMQLKQHIWQLMSVPSDKVSVIIKSFAFKRGIPFDADFVFDARCLPNPYWEVELRHLNGKDEEIAAFFNEKDLVKEYMKDLSHFSKKWINHFEANDRSYITIAVGCTGGQHRSVFLVEQLFAYLGTKGIQALILHRELD
ncbi:RNase adapter RapZ [Marinicella rhabdoformis]|uniref:RNase adapter RapZ n=1 Tax=Marinicella rhabdoformis TaxID=2580566 RepID=UPI0012AEC2BE|nr:RNase adapter RapZ [Marinicella rhabdoformis]